MGRYIVRRMDLPILLERLKLRSFKIALVEPRIHKLMRMALRMPLMGKPLYEFLDKINERIMRDKVILEI